MAPILTDYCEDLKVRDVLRRPWFRSHIPGLFVVKNPDLGGRTYYLSTAGPGRPTCSCPQGTLGRACKHLKCLAMIASPDDLPLLPEEEDAMLRSEREDEAATVQSIENAHQEAENPPAFSAPVVPATSPILRQRQYEAAIRRLREAERRGATGEALREAQAVVHAFCTPAAGGGVAKEVAPGDW